MVCRLVLAEKTRRLRFDSRCNPHLRQGFGMPIETAGAGGLVYLLAEGRRGFQSREGESIRALARTSQGKHGPVFGCKIAVSHQRQRAGDEGKVGSGSTEALGCARRRAVYSSASYAEIVSSCRRGVSRKYPPLLVPRISAMADPARTISGFV